MLKRSTRTFLITLAKHNNKTWFDEHREMYVAAKADFDDFVSLLIKKVAGFDKDLKETVVKDCTFRMNRDIRFSKDKTPYKVNMGASLNRGGKKSIYAGYYFNLEPGNKSFAGGGLWMPMNTELKKVRQEIDYNLKEFRDIIGSTKFMHLYGPLDTTGGVKLINLPRGYEKTNPAAEYVKLKSFIATKHIADGDLIKPSLVDRFPESFRVLMPFINFLNNSLG